MATIPKVLDLRSWLFDVRLVENSVTSLLIGNVENNENRGQKYPLQGWGSRL